MGLFYFISICTLKFQIIVYIWGMETQIRTDLVKVSTYARQKNKSTTWVYDQAKAKLITLVVIDGVKFVKI